MRKQFKREDLPIIVIGTGSVGVKFVNELLFRQPGALIKVFGGEEEQPYSRENLSKLLAGDISKDSLYTRNKIHASKDVKVYLNNPIISIDLEKEEVTDNDGAKHPYSKLVLAVGSSPRVEEIEGKDLKHVFILRNMTDAELLKSRQYSSRHTVVIGGGLVGLDVAYAMNKHKTKITIIENSTRLMSQLLDDHASVYLRLFLDDLGFDVRIETNVVSIEGSTSVEKVVLDDGDTIACDTVIFAMGMNPKTELAESIGLVVNRGIIVNDYLETSEENIYAIGECAEHRGRIYGTVQPGFEQAAALAKIVAGGNAIYTGSTIASQLGVVEYPILSIGDNKLHSDSYKEIKYRNIKRMSYRKLVLKNGHLQGVIAAGPWAKSNIMHDLVEKQQFIWPWQRKKFSETGNF